VSSTHQRSFPGADWDNETGWPEEMDGEDPEGSIGQDGSKCVKQDGTSLSQTSSISRVRTASASRRTLLHGYFKPGEAASPRARQAALVRTVGIVVLAALMGLTSWVVASISTWLVPVYVTAMALIFVMPQVQHLEGSKPSGEPTDVSGELACNASCPTSANSASPAPKPVGASGLLEVPATGSDQAGSPNVKRRPARSRARKPVKPAPVPIVATAPAAWIRIGPGKFVRANTQDPELTSAPELHAMFEAAKALVSVENCPPDLVEETSPTTVSGEVNVPIPADHDEREPNPEHETPSKELITLADPKAEPVTEEHGIAPSASGPGMLEAPLEENHGQEGTDLSGSSRTCTKAPTDAGDSNDSRYKWMQRELPPRLYTTTGSRSRLKMPQRLQNVRTGERKRGFRNPGRSASYSARAMPWSSLCRSSRAHRGYQPRSPPERS
jgi:hypothetical protein